MAFALKPKQSLDLIGPTWPKATSGLLPGSRGVEDADPALVGGVKLGENAQMTPLDCADINATRRGCLRDRRPDQHRGHECSCREYGGTA